MTTVRAPAKVNLTLHVTGRRDDGYHLLDSLVGFADIGDMVSVVPAPDLSLTVSGPFSIGVPRDGSNLVLRAARALQQARGVRVGARLKLDKHLPSAGGIGGGSSDAAATLALLAQVWQVDPLDPGSPEVLALGADVPVCMGQPAARRMSGIGDVLAPVPPLPDTALVLVNPKVPVATADVFARLATRENPAMDPLPEGLDFDAFVGWLGRQRNDLLAPAREVAPEIARCLDKLSALPQVRFAGMSGSGATCFGLCRTMADARQAARAMQVAAMSWWVAPAEMLQTSRATT